MEVIGVEVTKAAWWMPWITGDKREDVSCEEARGVWQ